MSMIRFAMTVAMTVVVTVSLSAMRAEAQVTVQQPVGNRFSARTTVSVPDRGEILMGGVNSARSSRTTTGPWSAGSSSSFDLQGTRMSVGVYIHDLAAMDEALLAQGSSQGDQSTHRFVAALAARHRTAHNETFAGETTPTVDSSAKAQRFERLAQAALERGSPAVARLHWQLAARYGSQLARQFLDQEASTLAADNR